MPNLVTNIVTLQFPSEASRQAFHAITSQTVDIYETAIRKALKVLLLGLSGHLQPNAPLPSLPNLILAGASYAPRGVCSDANDAYSSLLELISADARLTIDVMIQIDCIYEKSGAGTMKWSELDESTQFLFIQLSRKHTLYMDSLFTADYELSGAAFFNKLSRIERRPYGDTIGWFNFDDFVCRPMVGALSGFTSYLFEGRDGYRDNVATYGTKFKVKELLCDCVIDVGSLGLLLRFDSADNPAVEVIGAMFNLFGADGTHFIEDHEAQQITNYSYSAGELDGVEEADLCEDGADLKYQLEQERKQFLEVGYA
jgi:hypothetical protein